MAVTTNVYLNNIRNIGKVVEVFAGNDKVKKGATELQLVLAVALVAHLENQNGLLNKLTDTEIDYLRRGQKIPAIKSARERLNMGLVEAKAWVEKKGMELGLVRSDGSLIYSPTPNYPNYR